MVRGIAWDSLPNRYQPENNLPKKKDVLEQEIVPPPPFKFSRDVPDIGRRIAFGAVCGSITGACFGLVEVLRDPSTMKGKKSVATNKVVRFTSMFAGFFGAYHGVRKVLNLTVGQSKEMNILSAAAITVTPLVAVASLRAVIPYAVMLVAIDAFNELSE